MRRKEFVSKMLVAGLFAAFGAGLSMAQEAERAERRPRRWDPAQFRQRMLDRMKETLQATDEEWKVLEPKVEEVMTFSREANRSGRRSFFRRRRRSSDDENREQREQSDVETAIDALRTTLENKDAGAEEIKAKITALREAREQAKQKLAKAQEELRQLLTQRQEAEMIMMGYLN